ncbi:MAG: 16S rRNA (uracil(1498)-N(3))-methyltransferase [Acidobacteriota bacterium]|nr:16S rRNA (uracil(1498)-N(3))-methyltransferase [Blastocatellia bacterium]MDW8238530.1 16S rRNA (uracil(1498)-N(3))-methyltransferase [Acidobacteriota bacterium]
MSRHRFFAPPSAITENRIVLMAEESYHLQRVLRLRPGAIVAVFDGSGKEYTCSIQRLDHDQTELLILQETRPNTESELNLTLAQGLIKGEKFDLIVQKATELGLRRLIPLVTAHTVSSGAQRVSAARLARWQRIVLEATKQCGRTRLMEVTAPMQWREFIAELPPQTLLLCERSGESLQALRERWTASKPPNCLMVGPEGGWDSQELEVALHAGAFPVWLGPRILRAETAAIVALSLIQYLWGDLKQ